LEVLLFRRPCEEDRLEDDPFILSLWLLWLLSSESDICDEFWDGRVLLLLLGRERDRLFRPAELERLRLLLLLLLLNSAALVLLEAVLVVVDREREEDLGLVEDRFVISLLLLPSRLLFLRVVVVVSLVLLPSRLLRLRTILVLPRLLLPPILLPPMLDVRDGLRVMTLPIPGVPVPVPKTPPQVLARRTVTGILLEDVCPSSSLLLSICPWCCSL